MYKIQRDKLLTRIVVRQTLDRDIGRKDKREQSRSDEIIRRRHLSDLANIGKEAQGRAGWVPEGLCQEEIV